MVVLYRTAFIGLTEWAEILAEAVKFFGSPHP
jgi:hypothetical protein